MAKTLSWIIGVVFVLIGVLGFVGGAGIVGADGIFVTNPAHDLVHLISGIIFVIVALAAVNKASLVFKIFGVVYLLVAILGFFTVGTGGDLLGFLTTNAADHWLHLVLGVVILGLGFWIDSNKSGAMM